jgi:DNA-directed RNA polymerase subunit RPC12/RpoP
MLKQEYVCDDCDLYVTIRGVAESLEVLEGDDVDCPVCGLEMDRLD